jgi:hypothetical protein
MKVPLAEMAAAVVLAVGADAQTNVALSASSECLPASTAGRPCGDQINDQGSVQDLTPTQWLFGGDLRKKLTETPMPVVLEAHAQSRWTEAMDRVARERKPLPSATFVPRRQVVAPAARSEPSDTAQRYFVDEWRRTELDVADSVHHANIERIATTFDSLGRANVPDSIRTQVLRRLDRLNQANDYTWLMFKVEVMRRADREIARLRAGVPG